MSCKLVSTVWCTEDILIANGLCGRSSGLEAEFYV
jgi:hypothetical protein